jgi:hypothetical protein
MPYRRSDRFGMAARSAFAVLPRPGEASSGAGRPATARFDAPHRSATNVEFSRAGAVSPYMISVDDARFHAGTREASARSIKGTRSTSIGRRPRGCRVVAIVSTQNYHDGWFILITGWALRPRRRLGLAEQDSLGCRLRVSRHSEKTLTWRRCGALRLHLSCIMSCTMPRPSCGDTT